MNEFNVTQNLANNTNINYLIHLEENMKILDDFSNIEALKRNTEINNFANLPENTSELDVSSNFLTFEQFYKGAATLMFTFADVSCWPSIQNDMRNEKKFWQSMIIGNLVLYLKFTPMMVVSYMVLGSNASNIILQYSDSLINQITMAFITINVVSCYLVTFNPFCLTFEKVFGIRQEFGASRCILRGTFVILQIIIALGCPDFGYVVNLVGASTATCTSFIFPALFYMKLAHKSRNEEDCKQLKISKIEIVYMVVSMIFFTLLGITTTVNIFLELLNFEFGESCFSIMF